MNAQGLCRRDASEAGFGLAEQESSLLHASLLAFSYHWVRSVAKMFVWLWRFPMG